MNCPTFLYRFALSLCAAMWLNACSHTASFIPGSTLNTKNKDVIVVADAPENNLNQQAAIYPITFSLLEQMREPMAQARSNPALAQLKKNYRYHIGSGDVLSVKVWNQPDLNAFSGGTGKQAAQGTWVDETGHIFYPLAGKLYVRGKTLSEVRQMLTSKLARYFKQPQVDVNIAEFRSQNITVSGAVKQSGSFPLTNVPMTLVDAVAQAGGFTENADTDRIKWTHQGRDYTLSLNALVAHGDLAQNQLLTNGDMIFIPSRENVPVYVMGEVGKQSVLTIGNHGLSLTEAIAQSNGMNQNIANATGVFVIRNQPTRPNGKSIHIYQLNLQDATAYAMGTQFKLKPQDVVYVTAAPVARWNRVLSQIMPSVNSAILLNNVLFK